MKNIFDVLREKELQLKTLENQLEKLRAAAQILADDEERPFITSSEPQAKPVLAPPQGSTRKSWP